MLVLGLAFPNYVVSIFMVINYFLGSWNQKLLSRNSLMVLLGPTTETLVFEIRELLHSNQILVHLSYSRTYMPCLFYDTDLQDIYDVFDHCFQK